MCWFYPGNGYRTLSQFKSRHLVMLHGTTAMIPNRAALMAISGD